MTNASDVQYITRSVKTVRGLEARTRSKLEKEGWEFVSQTQGTIRSELNFRRPKPKTPWKWIGIGGGVIAILLVVLIATGAISDSDDADSVAAPTSTSSQAAPTKTSAPSVDPEPAAPEPVVAPAPEISVDELLDRLNSAGMGGLTVGDRFHLTGELFMSDLWMTGASGDYFIMLKAQGGAQDLSVFVDEADAARWHDGTMVEMVVETVEATINGETTNGWLRATSVKVIL